MSLWSVAERAGFEPANPCGLHTFQACALGQTTRPLHMMLFQRRVLYHKEKEICAKIMLFFMPENALVNFNVDNSPAFRYD